MLGTASESVCGRAYCTVRACTGVAVGPKCPAIVYLGCVVSKVAGPRSEVRVLLWRDTVQNAVILPPVSIRSEK